jgi:hypothetical protein
MSNNDRLSELLSKVPSSAFDKAETNKNIPKNKDDSALKGHGNERIFWVFFRNWFLIDPLHYLSSRSDFGFEFAEIFVIEKRLPNSASHYGESGSRYSNF